MMISFNIFFKVTLTHFLNESKSFKNAKFDVSSNRILIKMR